MDDEELRSVATVGDPVEAEMIQHLLRQEGIESITRGALGGGVFPMRSALQQILVPAALAERARELVLALDDPDARPEALDWRPRPTDAAPSRKPLRQGVKIGASIGAVIGALAAVAIDETVSLAPSGWVLVGVGFLTAGAFAGQLLGGIADERAEAETEAEVETETGAPDTED